MEAVHSPSPGPFQQSISWGVILFPGSALDTGKSRHDPKAPGAA